MERLRLTCPTRRLDTSNLSTPSVQGQIHCCHYLLERPGHPGHLYAREMNWTKILERSGVPEPPGYHETIARIKAKPAKPRVKPSRKSKKRPKRK